MDRARVFRHFRIAVSAVCLLACVLLMALWVRSYWKIYVVHCPRDRPILANVSLGIVQVNLLANSTGTGWGDNWAWKSFPLDDRWAKRPSWHWGADRYITSVNFPLWTVILPLSLVAIVSIPWGMPRFSLRTLLIAMTLVSLILGTIIATTR